MRKNTRFIVVIVLMRRKLSGQRHGKVLKCLHVFRIFLTFAAVSLRGLQVCYADGVSLPLAVAERICMSAMKCEAFVEQLGATPFL